MPRPPFGTPEWLANFREIINTSSTRNEAVQRLGYANPSIIYYHLKKLGMKRPPQWNLKPEVSRQRRNRVPEVILRTEGDRIWVACLTQGEGLIGAHPSKKQDATALEIRIGMVDQDPIFHFCDLVGIKRPRRSGPRAYPRKCVWYAAIGGLRAYRALQEILPFLFGQKQDEAKRALAFFAPDGYRKGHYGGYDIWPPGEFPLRKRGFGMYMASLRGRFAHSGEDFPLLDERQAPLQETDRSCIRIAEDLLNTSEVGRSLVELMDDTGLAWPTVIHHLKHLKENLFVTRENIWQGRSGPRWLYKATPKLADLRDRGWIFLEQL